MSCLFERIVEPPSHPSRQRHLGLPRALLALLSQALIVPRSCELVEALQGQHSPLNFLEHLSTVPGFKTTVSVFKLWRDRDRCKDLNQLPKRG